MAQIDPMIKRFQRHPIEQSATTARIFGAKIRHYFDWATKRVSHFVRGNLLDTCKPSEMPDSREFIMENGANTTSSSQQRGNALLCFVDFLLTNTNCPEVSFFKRRTSEVTTSDGIKQKVSPFIHRACVSLFSESQSVSNVLIQKLEQGPMWQYLPQ